MAVTDAIAHTASCLCASSLCIACNVNTLYVVRSNTDDHKVNWLKSFLSSVAIDSTSLF